MALIRYGVMMAIVQSRRGKEGRQNIRWEEGVKPGKFFWEKFLKLYRALLKRLEISSRP